MNQQSTRFFDRITIYSAQAARLRAEMALLFGADAGLFRLGNTDIEVVSGNPHSLKGRAALVGGISLYTDARHLPADRRGLLIQPAQRPADLITRVAATEPGIQSVDHLVLRTGDADDCIRLFRDDIGMRLALDQTVQEWGGRMLFFREGGMTLEVIENSSKRPEQDFFWGICYRCGDIDAVHAELVARGVLLSDIREGRKPGTRVATIKSHVGGVPSLLLG